MQIKNTEELDASRDGNKIQNLPTRLLILKIGLDKLGDGILWFGLNKYNLFIKRVGFSR